jgi:hypothetical protein
MFPKLRQRAPLSGFTGHESLGQLVAQQAANV